MRIFKSRRLYEQAWKNHQMGFSMIELMVVVAIISILGMIAVPQYQTFAAKAKVAAALSELAAGKAGLEIHLTEGHYGQVLKPADLGLPEQGSQCERIEVSSYELFCSIKSESVLRSASLTLRRERTGTWTCHPWSIPDSLLPTECRKS